MTTAAQKLAEYGITMEQAHAWLLQQTDPAYVVSVFSLGGITNAMVGEIAGYPGPAYSAADVRAFFSLYGVNSAVLDPAPVVTSVSSDSVIEGGSLWHTVTLSETSASETHLSLAITAASVSLDDFSGVSLTNGAQLDGLESIVVPAGVSSFTFTLDIASDSSDELDESYTIAIGGVSAMGTIIDDDDTAEPSEPLLPDDFMALVSLVTLNTNTGVLSNATLHQHIVAATNEADYLDLFSPDGIEGAEDGFWTPAELGFDLGVGSLPATAETVESILFGTFIKALKSVDFNEIGTLNQYKQTGNFDLLVSVLIDPAVNPLFSNANIAAELESGVADLVEALAMGQNPDIFDLFLNL